MLDIDGKNIMYSMDLLKILFITFSALISLIDIKRGAIPRLIFIFALPFFIIIIIMKNELYLFQDSIIGFLAGLIIFILAYLFSKKKLGLADVWFSALIGLVLGFRHWYAAMGIACIIGIIFMLISKKCKIPFIPFMAIGSILILMIF